MTHHFEALERILQFFSFSDKSSFDPRWFSGDWSDQSSLPLHFDLPSHVQDLPERTDLELSLSLSALDLSVKVSSMKV